MSCHRCGELHSTKQCKASLPTVEFLAQQIQNNINKALQSIPSEWKKDSFGYYLPSIYSNPDSSENRDNEQDTQDHPQLYCLNCGRKGHSAKKCTMPQKTELQDQFNLLKHNGQTKQKNQEVINTLTQMLEQK